MKIDNIKYITGIKIKTNVVTAELIKLIKKYRNDAISEIKNDIENNQYVLACSSVDYESYDKLLDCYDELKKANFKVEIYENDEKQDIKYVRNWAKSMHETSDYIDNEDIF